MDGTAPEIVLDENGVCNFCHQAESELRSLWATDTSYPPSEFVAQIIKNDKQKYDCIIGLSGGVDSSYMLHKAVELGLRPLCFSVDNGWNSKESDENILRIVEKLKVPFYRYTIDVPKFQELQGAFMQAGLKNLEIPTDHILMATTYEMAAEYGIKTILSGGNVATESIMPPSWGYNARDLTHIKDVYRRMTGKKLTGLPVCSIWKWNYYRWVKKIKTVYLLDYLNYNRAEAEQILIKEYGFKSTGEKHEESLFTRWFQNFYLFGKWGIDKRKAHYSSMIASGQMTRAEAKEKLLVSPVYPQLGFEPKVSRYLKHEHEEFKMDRWYNRISKVVKLFS